MVPSITNRAVLVMSAAVAVVGSVDAAVAHDLDLAVVFGLVLLLQLVLLLRLSMGRVSVAVRADLVRWMRDRAAQEGDAVELIADRALAAYRAELLGCSVGEDRPRAADAPVEIDGRRAGAVEVPADASRRAGADDAPVGIDEGSLATVDDRAAPTADHRSTRGEAAEDPSP